MVYGSWSMASGLAFRVWVWEFRVCDFFIWVVAVSRTALGVGLSVDIIDVGVQVLGLRVGPRFRAQRSFDSCRGEGGNLSEVEYSESCREGWHLISLPG